MHLKPPLEPHLTKHGLTWPDVVSVLEEVDSIDELKAAAEKPIAFLDRVSKAGAENLGITTSAGLLVLEVVPDGQGAQKGVQVGNLISHVGSTSLSNCNGSDSESTRMDIKFGSLLSEARAAEVACVTIKFNGHKKGRVQDEITAGRTRQPSDHAPKDKERRRRRRRSTISPSREPGGARG